MEFELYVRLKAGPEVAPNLAMPGERADLPAVPTD